MKNSDAAITWYSSLDESRIGEKDFGVDSTGTIIWLPQGYAFWKAVLARSGRDIKSITTFKAIHPYYAAKIRENVDQISARVAVESVHNPSMRARAEYAEINAIIQGAPEIERDRLRHRTRMLHSLTQIKKPT